METPQPWTINQPRFTGSERTNRLMKGNIDLWSVRPAELHSAESQTYQKAGCKPADHTGCKPMFRPFAPKAKTETRTRIDPSCESLRGARACPGRLRRCPARTAQ